jgi:hypothetical protein
MAREKPPIEEYMSRPNGLQSSDKMLSRRNHQRNSTRVYVELLRDDKVVGAEVSTIENFSLRGVRVISTGRCPINSTVILKSLKADLWARARVVYCDALNDGFAIGLEFLAYTGHWANIIRTWLPLAYASSHDRNV